MWYLATGFWLCLVNAALLSGVKGQDKWDGSSMIAAHVFWRGGIHTFEEENQCKTLPYNFNEGIGELTTEGKQDTYNMGLFLNSTFGHLYKYTYEPYSIRLWHGWKNHSIEDAQLIAAALFPPRKSYEIWNENLLWQPIPTHMNTLLGDGGLFHIVYEGPVCPSQIDTVVHSAEVKKYIHDNRDIIHFLCHNAQCEAGDDQEILQAFQAFQIAACIGIQTSHPEDLPVWIKDSDARLNQTLQYPANFLRLLTTFPSMRSLSGGWMIGQVISEFDMFLNPLGHWHRSFSGYSMHVDVMTGFTSILGKVPDNWPKFGSILSIQLHKIATKNFVQVWYWDTIQEQPKKLNLEDCSDPCPWEDFAKLARWDPGDRDAACQGRRGGHGHGGGRDYYTTQAPCTTLAGVVAAEAPAVEAVGAGSGVAIAFMVIFLILFLVMGILYLRERKRVSEAGERIRLTG